MHFLILQQQIDQLPKSTAYFQAAMEQETNQIMQDPPKKVKSGAQRQASYRAKTRQNTPAESVTELQGEPSLQAGETNFEKQVPTIQGKYIRTGLGPAKIIDKSEKLIGLQKAAALNATTGNNAMTERMNIDSKIQRLANQQLPDLHQMFLGSQSEEERSAFIDQTVRENIFLLLEYMEAYQSPSQDFLHLIITIGRTLEESTFTKLLVRVCKMHRCEILSFSAGMVVQVMSFLCDTKQDNTAANGMLRLIFQNDISLAGFPVPLLIAFQAQYDRVIANHFSSIQELDKAVIESLPASVFCITSPLLISLKHHGHVLHHNIPFQFLPYVLEIVGLSFTECQDSFTHFFNILQAGCRRFQENLLEFKFEQLLEALCVETKVTSSIFFGSLQEHTKILTKAFELIAEKRLTKFDGPMNQMLIKGSQESFQAMKNRPKILSASKQSLIQRTVQEFQLQNPTYTEDISLLATPITSEQTQVFASMDVENLLVQQLIAFNHCVSKQSVGHYFIQYPTGQGKTALCFAIGAWRALTGECVVVANSSDELTFRDYKNAARAARALNLSIFYQTQEEPPHLRDGSLYYMTTGKLNHLLANNLPAALFPRCLLIDEFDSFIFNHESENAGMAIMQQNFSSIFAFTGSELLEYHRTYIQNELCARNINMSNIMTSQASVVCHGIKVFDLIPQFKSEVVQLSKQYTALAPVIIIADTHRERIKKSLISGGLPVEDIAESSPAAIESSLSVFSCKQSGLYPVFLVSEQQGRGIDFPSTSEIEKNGGIFVLIFKQFLGRTGRIGNKGQYAIMLYDKLAKNCEGQVYLQKKLEELKNSEIIYMASLRRVNQQFERAGISGDQVLESALGEQGPYARIESPPVVINQDQPHQVSIESTVVVQATEAEEESKHDPNTDTESNNEEQKADDFFPRESRKRDCKHETKVEVRYQSKLRPRDSHRADIDFRYFQGYSDPSIHSEMLQDRVRMDCYQEAIRKACHGRIVIDVGAGTGVLSVMAAQAGAKIVYAIEFSGIAKQAREAAAQNKVGDQIVVIQERAEDVTLPIERADVVLSEWMGYFLLFENMLPSVNHIRKQYLSEGGIMIPYKASIHLAAFRRPRKDFGLNLSFFNKAMSCKAEIDICKADEVVSAPSNVLDIDLTMDELRGNQFQSRFSLGIQSDGEITGLVGWFDVILFQGVELSTSPSAPPTHWKQTLFYFDQPLAGKAQSKFEGQIKVSPSASNHRALDISFSFAPYAGSRSRKQFYTLE